MADNYIEKKMEELRSGGARTVKSGPTLDTLLLRNRSCRGYKKDYVVKRLQLERIVGVTTRVASARNQQVLRYRLVTAEDQEASRSVLKNIHLGGALPELHLPFPGTEPEAFIVICSTVPETRYVDIDLGIAAQSMLLKATEMGLAGIVICAFDPKTVMQELELPYPPVCIIAIGKPAETFRLQTIKPEESRNYFREAGVHVVPKLALEDILI